MAADINIGLGPQHVQKAENEQRAHTKEYNDNKRCVYCSANRSSFPRRKFFRFPKNAAMSKKWVLVCERPFLLSKSVDQLYQSHRICSEHFCQSDYATSKMCRLKSTAYPRFNADLANNKNNDGSNMVATLRRSLSTKLIMAKNNSRTLIENNIPDIVPVFTCTPKTMDSNE